MPNSDTYSEIAQRFKDWLQTNNTGGNVTDVTLSFANSAQKNLWLKYNWDELVKEGSLTASASSQALPTDCGKIIAVGHDSDSDGIMDYYYYRNDRDRAHGYKIRNTFAKATGESRTIEFFVTPSVAPTLIYQPVLTDFANSGTEYSFFPMELLLLEMQVSYLQESGLMELGEYQGIMQRRNEILADFVAAYQYINPALKMEVTDYNGDVVDVDEYDLTGNLDSTNLAGHSNSYDWR